MSANSPKRRIANSPKRAPKRSKITKLIPDVVAALTGADNIAADLRTLLKHSLPVVLSADKADRGPYEVEVVQQAEESLAEVLAVLEQKHGEALSKQNEIIAESEHQGRIRHKADADAALEAAKAKHKACSDARHAAQQAVHDAHTAQKAAEKEVAAADREIQHLADQKAALANLLTSEFALLRDGSSAGAQGKKAVQQVLSMGKKYSFDSTLLQTFPMTCKKTAASRSEFEQSFFSGLQVCIDGQINTFTQKLAEAEPIKAQKYAAVATAKSAFEAAEASVSNATEEQSAAHASERDARKNVSKAEASLSEIWNDMKKVCDAQDEVAAEVANFKDNVLGAFQQLKEKEPEPEPVEEAPLDAAPAEAVTEAAAPAEETAAAA